MGVWELACSFPKDSSPSCVMGSIAPGTESSLQRPQKEPALLEAATEGRVETRWRDELNSQQGASYASPEGPSVA